MKILEVARMFDGKPIVVARMTETGEFEGDTNFESIMSQGAAHTLSSLNNGYIISRVKEVDETIDEARVYVDSPTEVPEDVQPERGPRGGVFYETEGDDGAWEDESTPDPSQTVNNYTKVQGFLKQATVEIMSAFLSFDDIKSECIDLSEADDGFGTTGYYCTSNLTGPKGEYLGKTEIVFYEDGTINHSLIVIDEKYQGTGIAKRMMAAYEDKYREAGFTEISLLADIDVGLVTWPLIGFDFETEEDKDKLKVELIKFMRKSSLESVKVGTEFISSGKKYIVRGATHDSLFVESDGQVDQLSAEKFSKLFMPSVNNSIDILIKNNSLEHAWDFSSLDTGEEFEYILNENTYRKNKVKGKSRLGKSFLLSLQGKGIDLVKSLDTTSLGYQVGQIYYNKK